jgi:hypothetical protein
MAFGSGLKEEKGAGTAPHKIRTGPRTAAGEKMRAKTRYRVPPTEPSNKCARFMP